MNMACFLMGQVIFMNENKIGVLLITLKIFNIKLMGQVIILRFCSKELLHYKTDFLQRPPTANNK